MSSIVDAIKRQELQQRLDGYIKEYQAVAKDILSTLDPGAKVRLTSKLESIELEMRGVEVELKALGGSTTTPQVPPESQKPSRMLLSDATQVDLTTLRDAIVANFISDELEALCLDIQQDRQNDGLTERVSLDIVGGRTLVMQAQNLIGWLDRRGQLGYLIRLIREQRPGAI